MSAIVYSTYGSFGPEAVQTFDRLKHEGAFGKRFVSRLALVVVKAVARQALSAFGMSREHFGLSAAALPAQPSAAARSTPSSSPPAQRSGGRRAAEQLVDEVDEPEPGGQRSAGSQQETGDVEDAEPDTIGALQPPVLQCSQCKHERGQSVFAAAHWSGTISKGPRNRKCFHCAPRTVLPAQSFCPQCDQCKDHRAFNPERQNRKSRKKTLCRSCEATNTRKQFFDRGPTASRVGL